MKKILTFLLVSILFLNSCKNDGNNRDVSDLDVVAKPITITCLIQNDNPMNDWQTECFKNIDVQKLATFVFDAIYAGKVTAYNYITDAKMTIEEVKAFETEPEHKRSEIGKALFTEDWYIDNRNLQMVKKVNSIMLAYKVYNDAGEVSGHSSGVRIYLNGTKPETEKK